MVNVWRKEQVDRNRSSNIQWGLKVENPQSM